MRQIRHGTLAVAMVLALLGGRGFAQGPGVAGKDRKTYTKTTSFHLPVKIEDRFRDNLREMVLYVKAGQADWMRQEAIAPTGTHFTYKVPQDGEYWFTVVMVDRAGRATPADVGQAPPGLKVVVDTQPPLLEVRPWTSPEGELYLKCLILDPNPDLNSLRLTYAGENGQPKVIEPMPNLPGLFRVVGPEMLAAPVRVTAADVAGNQTHLDVNVRDLVANSTPGGGVPTIQSGIATTSAKIETRVPGSDTINAVNHQPPQVPPVAAPPSASPMLPGDSVPLPGLPTPPGSGANISTGGVPSGGIGVAEAPRTIVANGAPSNRQLLNTTQATVEYRIDQVGPSGVGKVEVYLTADQGATWQRAREDQDKRSPADIDLPGEGLFGIRLVLTNGNGFGGTAPQRGESPNFWIEVDTTAPFVQLLPVEPNASSGTLDIRWKATDKNLGAEPVTLLYRSRTDSPWQVIARVKNDGQYRWAFPRDIGSQFFIKIEAVDQAGNVARAETPNAIVLDMTEPRAVVVGVTGATARPTPPTGN